MKKIIDKEIDICKNLGAEKRMSKSQLATLSKQKEKGRISMPEEDHHEDMQKRYENLRRMPFSLNEDGPCKDILSGIKNAEGKIEELAKLLQLVCKGNI